jgi:hypothetical protein
MLRFPILRWWFEICWWSIKIGPGISDDFCNFIWSGGGYHSRDIRKRNTPKIWKRRRMRSILC